MAGDTPATTERRGTGSACLRCRSRKVRCSGSRPCTNCQRRSSDCQFDLDEKRVVISERLLHELQQRSDRASTIDEGLMPAAKRPRINQELDTERVNSYGACFTQRRPEHSINGTQLTLLIPTSLPSL
ncbi:hypothetical protein IQ07DRAFT_588897 [Pyrenochaeta sp. DS3sAY3a]|nr:hypothetical protein IQ07DRAFT_588897 [Pyrenochaeta sp. DS3sAY3a]